MLVCEIKNYLVSLRPCKTAMHLFSAKCLNTIGFIFCLHFQIIYLSEFGLLPPVWIRLCWCIQTDQSNSNKNASRTVPCVLDESTSSLSHTEGRRHNDNRKIITAPRRQHTITCVCCNRYNGWRIEALLSCSHVTIWSNQQLCLGTVSRLL